MSWVRVKQFTCVIHILYQCVSMCMFVQWTQTIGLCVSASRELTHTAPLYTQFRLASIKLQQFRDSKTGTIWSSLPASHFLPSPSCSDGEREKQTDEFKGKTKTQGNEKTIKERQSARQRRRMTGRCGFYSRYVCLCGKRWWFAVKWSDSMGKLWAHMSWGGGGVDYTEPNSFIKPCVIN